MTYPESDVQFLARMIVATREGNQISAAEARRLNNVASFGDSHERGQGTTLPEERRSGSQLPDEAGASDVVKG